MTTNAALVDFANHIFADAQQRGLDPADALSMLGLVVTSIIAGAYPPDDQHAAALEFAVVLVQRFDADATRH